MAMAASMKEFLLAALREDQRLDGRRPFESRILTVNFGREDGGAEVQLGQTRIMCAVTCQLVQPYPDQPNEGILAVYTEFSPMADPTFEVGRPGEYSVEIGRLIERGLRDSRAIDTESLCVLSGKAVWSLRVDIHVLDNGGNLIDAANIAALAALLAFRRPECSLAGAGGQDVIIYPAEVREPVPLIVHYLPIAFTFGLFGDGELLVMDPSYKEELLMKGRLTIILNVHGDICAIQKGGGVGVASCDILRCLRIASMKVADVTSSLRKAVEAHELERTQRKAKRQQNLHRVETVAVMDSVPERCVVLEDAVIASSLNASDIESSGDESLDSLTSEEVANITGLNSVRVLKQESERAVGQLELEGAVRDPLAAPLMYAPRTDHRKEIGKLVPRITTGLHADRAVEVLGSAAGHADHKLLVQESDQASDRVSQDLQKMSIRKSGDAGNAERGDTSSIKDKPRSLLDAVKWGNVKRKKSGAMQA